MVRVYVFQEHHSREVRGGGEVKVQRTWTDRQTDRSREKIDKWEVILPVNSYITLTVQLLLLSSAI